MNFLEAIEAIKQRKKVRYKGMLCDTRNPELIIDGIIPVILTDTDKTKYIPIGGYYGEWEIFQPKKTLCDKIESNPWLGSCFKISDVREALRELQKELQELQDEQNRQSDIKHYPNFEYILEDIFGEELL